MCMIPLYTRYSYESMQVGLYQGIVFPGGPVIIRICFYLYLGLSQLDIVVELRQRKHILTSFKHIKAIKTCWILPWLLIAIHLWIP